MINFEDIIIKSIGKIIVKEENLNYMIKLF